LTPKKTVQTLSACILSTLREIGEVKSANAQIQVKDDPLGTWVYCTLTSATIREKSVFAQAMGEMFSSIDNPRYVLIKQYGFRGRALRQYHQSYACPSIIGGKKENVAILARYLKKVTGSFEILYTRSEDGHKALLKCRRRSYINLYNIHVKGKRVADSKKQ